MIPLFKVFIAPEVDAPLLATLHSGYIGQGKRVEEFERALAPFVQNENVLTVNSGTAALNLALRLANVGPNSEVISSPMTCLASNMPILERGADIVWADINPSTGNIDPDDIKHLITSRTKAILCIHYGGYPCDLDEINEIGTEYGIPIIEDAAHAFCAVYKGGRIGSYSDFVCFSFQAIKHITSIDGGACVCRNKSNYERGKLLRWYGIDREEGGRVDYRCENDVAEWGHKYHLNDICATVGLANLKYTEKIMAAHRFNAYLYDSELSDMRGIHLPKYYQDRISSYWLYLLFVDNRSAFMEYMREAGIAVSRVHARNDKHSFARKYDIRPLPGVDEFFNKQVAIPVGQWLTRDDKEYIINKMREFDGAI